MLIDLKNEVENLALTLISFAIVAASGANLKLY